MNQEGRWREEVRSEDGRMKKMRGERQPGNAKVMEDESRGGEVGRGEGGARKVGMKVREENAVPGIENERGREKW